MSAESIVGRDLYYARTTATGIRTVSMARVWDGARFIASQQKQAVEQAAKDGTPADKITTATQDEYRAARH